MNTQKDHLELLNELVRATKLIDVAEKLAKSSTQDFAKATPSGEESLANSLAGLLRNTVAYDAPQKQWYLWDGQLHKPVEAGASIDITAGFALRYLKEIIDAYTDAKKDLLNRGSQAQELVDAASKDEREALQAAHGEAIAEGKGVSSALAGPIKMWNHLQSNRHQKSIAEMLQRKLPLNTAKRDDDDKRYLVFRNYVLDMRAIKPAFRDKSGAWQYPEVETLEHEANRLVWRAIPHDWNAEATASNWGHLLSRDSFHDDHEARILEQIMGIGLSGQVKRFPKHMVSLFGETNSGKGLIGEALERTYPEHVSINDQRIVQKVRNGDEQARLRNNIKHSRVVIASECTNEADGDFLLNYAGNGNYSVRQMQVNPELVEPRGILIMTSNEPVKVDTNKEEMRDRLFPVFMPYRRKPETHPDEWANDDMNISGPYRVEGGKVIKPMDSTLPAKLDAEVEGISVRLIQAYQEALAASNNKVLKTEPMEARLREASAEADMFELYLREYSDLSPSTESKLNKYVRVRELHTGYEDLCRRNRKTPMTLIGFGRKLNGHSFNGQELETKEARGGSRLVGFQLSMV